MSDSSLPSSILALLQICQQQGTPHFSLGSGTRWPHGEATWEDGAQDPGRRKGMKRRASLAQPVSVALPRKEHRSGGAMGARLCGYDCFTADAPGFSCDLPKNKGQH